jgi:two-component system nitrate/nitrite response regulator NarL
MSASNTQPGSQVLIASDDSSLANRYSDLLGDEFTVTRVNTALDAMEFLKQHCPQLAMIDPLLFQENIKSSLSDMSAASTLTRILVVEDTSDRSLDQMALFKSGAHGFIADNISPALLVKSVHSVSKGEVWVPRKLINQLISELARGAVSSERRKDPATRKSMSRLTPRELEVAQMVHSGGNNKLIARELAISERTVKAHLSAIFRKLNIENRLHLALFFNQVS